MMSEALTYLLLMLIGSSIAIFIVGMLALIITRHSIKLYYTDSNVDEKLLRASEEDDLTNSRYLIEPSMFTGKSVLDESKTNVSKKTLLSQAFLTASTNKSLEVVKYLLDKPLTIRAVSSTNLVASLKAICQISDRPLIQLFLQRFKDPLEKAYAQTPQTLIEEVTRSDDLVVLQFLVQNFDIIKPLSSSVLYTTVFLTCCRYDRINILNKITNRLLEMKNKSPFSNKDEYIDKQVFIDGYHMAFHTCSALVLKFYIEEEYLQQFCVLDLMGIDKFIQTDTNLIPPMQSLLQLKPIEFNYKERADIAIYIMENHKDNKQCLPLVQLLLCDEIPRTLILTLDDAAILASASFAIEEVRNAWIYTTTLCTKNRRAKDLLPNIITENKVAMMNTISQAPIAYAIELFCNTVFRKDILGSSNIMIRFLNDVLLKNPVIESYSSKKISQKAFAAEVTRHGLDTEVHKALSALEPDQLNVEFLQVNFLSPKVENTLGEEPRVPIQAQ